MEVHHHPDLHHRRKHLREYFLEFIMIFLAVTLGFLAESLREKRADRAKEIEFIYSMIEDAKTDTANTRQALALNMKRIHYLDTLANDCYAYGMNGTAEAEIYRVFRKCIRHPDLVSPTERTLAQLKSAGGMRLIQKKVAADSIIQYDDFAKKLADQQTYYERYLNAMVDQSMKVINYHYYPSDTVPIVAPILLSFDSAKLMTSDKAKVIELGNDASIYKGVVMFYIVRLHEGNQRAVDLIATLKKEYHIN